MGKTSACALILLGVMGCNSTKPSPNSAPSPSSAPSPGSAPISGLAQGSDPAAAGAAAESNGAAKTALSKTPDKSVVSQHCGPGPAPVSLIALRDSSGFIGGYVFKRLILDSPISYLDSRGSEVAMFHIFGSPEEKKLNAPVIDALRAAYPVETPVECPQGNPPGHP